MVTPRHQSGRKRVRPAPAVRRTARGKRKPAKRGSAGAGGRFPEVEELVELMNRHDLVEVDIHESVDGSRHIRVARAGAPWHGAAATQTYAPRGAALTAADAGSAAQAQGAGMAAGAAAPAAAAGETLHAFKSPMVGTFYRAPSPEVPSFVSVGDKVDSHTTVCIIEAMKVMNEITPDIAGTVVSMEVENGEAVEFGQTLFLIRPA